MAGARDLELLRAVAQETPLVVYAKDRDRRFVLSNQMHAALLGQPVEQILGRTDTDLFGSAAAEVERHTERVLQEGKPIASEYELPIAGETRTYLETIFPLHDRAGDIIGAGGIALDITARRALERSLGERAAELERAMQQIEAANAELLRQQRLAALGPVVASVAHEVNTPLGVALTAVTLAEDKVNTLRESFATGSLSRGALRSGLDEIAEATRLSVNALDRAARLMRSFKQVAVDRNTPELRTVLLSEWLEEIDDSLRPMVKRAGVNLEVVLGEDLLVVIAAGELQQVISNLVVNALVHAFPERSEQALVRVELRRIGEELDLSVIDNGVGMPPEVAARATEPFFTTRRASGGSGLGLHIASSIATGRFGGLLCLDSIPGRGTGVHLRLPLGSSALAVVRG